MNAGLIVRSVTLDDVAAIAGVSAKTVSRVVNNDSKVSPETRKRIQKAIDQIGYLPNLAARSLATAQTKLIGLFTPPSNSHFFSQLVRTATRSCREKGYNLVIEECDITCDSAALVYKSGLRNLRCSGIILPAILCDDMDLLDLLEVDSTRYVRIAPATQLSRAPYVTGDHAGGSTAIARHLWSLGHRRFGMVTGIPAAASTILRRDAFIKTIIESGGSLSDFDIIELPHLLDENQGPAPLSLVDAGRLAGQILLKKSQRPSAIYTYNDDLAAGIIIQAHNMGISVPEQLSIAGFDDSDIAQLCWPALTTARQPISEIAMQAVEILTSSPCIPHQAIVCSTELVIRQSTGAVGKD